VNALVTSSAIWYVMRGSGVVSLLLLTAVVVLGIATSKRWTPRELPRFVTASLHRSVALLSVVFVGLHVLSAVFDPYAVVGVAAVFVPFVAGRGAFWVGLGALSLDLILALIVSSLVRSHLSPRLWRGVHWLAYAAWPVALAHGVGLGSDRGATWFVALTGLCIATVIALLGWRVHGRAGGSKRLERQPVPRLESSAGEALG
jgi:sulfoxide reductase heme-binding subunit YedZ